MKKEQTLEEDVNVEKKSVGKKVIDILVNIFTVIMVVLSIFLVVISLTSKETNGVPTINNKSYLRVQTDSMQGTINKGDLIVINKVEFKMNKDTQYLEPSIEIKKNESIISFFYDIDGDAEAEVVTHKVVDIQQNGQVFITQGTHVKDGDILAQQTVPFQAVIGVYNGKRVPVIGGIYSFLMDTPYAWGFALCVLAPMFIIFLYKGYKLIITIIETKKENAIETAKETSKVTEEELAKQKEAMRAEILKELGIDDDKTSTK